MHPLQKRFALFLLGCVPVRLALVYMVATGLLGTLVLKWLAAGAAALAAGFMVIFVGGFRKTGPETGGALIWWNWLRPVHALLWACVAYFAWRGQSGMVWRLLLADVIIGLVSFLVYHWRAGSFQKLSR